MIKRTSPIAYRDDIDSIWNHPTDLDLLELTKSSLISTTPRQTNSFAEIPPSIRRLFTIFDSICPDVYRIHSSDSLTIFNELLCLIDEYLRIQPKEDLLENEIAFEEFLSQLRRPSVLRQKSSSLIKSKFSCFGQGIQSNHPNNQLNRTLIFCFELTTKSISLPIQICIYDPDGNVITNRIQYINTYAQGHTKLYSCSYRPTHRSGIYRIYFNSRHRKIADQYYEVYIHDENTIENKSIREIPQYELEGDGYSTKIIVNSIARFRLRLKSSKHNLLEYFALSIFDPYGHKIVVQHRILASDLLELTYQPMSVGQHRLQVCFNQKFHREIFLDVIHDEINLLSKLKPFGPGLKRAIAGQPTEFYVDLNQTSEHNQIHFRFEASYQAEIDYEQQLATVKYTPMSEGYLPIEIIENERELSSSPFLVYVENLANIKSKPNIRVIGLDKQLILHRKNEFQVYIDNPFDDRTHTLHVEIITEHEQLPSVSIQRHHSSTAYTCSFIPTHSGRHLISIDYAGIVAQSNPFICQAIQEKDILLTGPAIQNQCLTLNEPTYFAFSLQDFLNSTYSDKTTTYESGYSSNDDMSSSKSSSYNDIPMIQTDENKNYQVTITDGHGNIKPNVYVQELADKQNDNLIRVDFTPDEKILYINISCTW